ncbi:MAG: SPOR domain-containing protein [Pseudomonadota bacterium]
MKVFHALFLAHSYLTRRVVTVMAGALGVLLVLYSVYGPNWGAAMKKAMSPFGAQSASASLKGAAPAEPFIRMGRLSYELSQTPPQTQSESFSHTSGVEPRVIEGRDFVMPATPAPATLASSEGAAGNSGSGKRNALESPRTPSGFTVMGVSPTPAMPQSPPRVETTATPDLARRGESEIESRLAATREWLAATAQTTHTLQLFGANSEEQLKADLATLSSVLSPSELHVYRTLIAGKPAYAVVYGSYPDRRAAVQALDKLPATLAVNRPLVRTVNGIRGEQKRNGI